MILPRRKEPLRHSRRRPHVPPDGILFAVPTHPNENADQEQKRQIDRDFLFRTHPYTRESQSSRRPRSDVRRVDTTIV